jgi:oxygen-independent coproporphyrinogen-3 oxidase
MDHFARADDELARAQRAGTLQQNFQGYSTHADCDLLACGVTGIGRIGNAYSQIARTLDEYYALVGAGKLSNLRGYACRADDLLRRNIIETLMCRFEPDFGALAARMDCNPMSHFAAEFANPAPFASDGLLAW